MTHFSQTRPARRAPRAKLRWALPITIQLENGRRFQGKLHQLSTTGGLLEVGKFVEERTRVGLTLPLGAGVVYPQAEMMFPMRGAQAYLQPFWFTGLRAEERERLDQEITELLRQSMATARAAYRAGLQAPRLFREST